MNKKLRLKFLVGTFFRFFAALLFIGLVLFGPAGSLDYWEAYVYIAVLFLPLTFVVIYFLKFDPEFLVRRMKMKEKEAAQRKVIGISNLLFFIGFILPGLDFRFGWSNVPTEIVYAANAAVFLGYAFVFLVFRENSYASRVIEVVKGQKVISTGPYHIIRHPMYLGVIIMFLATPLALGSYYGLIPFLPLPVLLGYRIKNEEEVLTRDLAGYKEYKEKTRYRLIPYVW
jgi:protein-S-isoprenylcysteine O-methyltransferase Ste14